MKIIGIKNNCICFLCSCGRNVFCGETRETDNRVGKCECGIVLVPTLAALEWSFHSNGIFKTPYGLHGVIRADDHKVYRNRLQFSLFRSEYGIVVHVSDIIPGHALSTVKFGNWRFVHFWTDSPVHPSRERLTKNDNNLPEI